MPGDLLAQARQSSRMRTESPAGSVTLTQGGKLVYYIVQNKDVGFNDQFADRLSEPFQRLHDSNEFKDMGTGLATVRRVARRHGGRAQSEPSSDTALFFTLARKDLP